MENHLHLIIYLCINLVFYWMILKERFCLLFGEYLAMMQGKNETKLKQLKNVSSSSSINRLTAGNSAAECISICVQ